KGGKAKVLLSPPVLSPMDAEGRPKKLAFGGWMLNGAFPLLARMKRLRGTPLDPFGRSEERKAERALITAFEASLDRIVEGLTPERHATAVKLASVPQSIRGFGHVKSAAIEAARAEDAKLWRAWEVL